METIVIVHGPMASGKTSNAPALKRHFGCRRVVELDSHTGEGTQLQPGDLEWGSGQPRTQFAGAEATLKALDRKAKRLGKPLSVFHNSLSDFFDKEVPVQWRISALRAMVDTPHLVHLLLTKRIGNAREMLETAFRAIHAQREGWANNVPPNIWIGATICNQEEADRDIPKLLAVPAAKRFLSMEPLLGPVSFEGMFASSNPADGTNMLEELDWVIVGGESGHNARPIHPDWARSLRDQCVAAGVPFLFKQWGEWTPGENVERNSGAVRTAFWLSNRWIFHFELLENTEGVFSDEPDLYRVGKKAAGRLIDGRTWDEVPA